MLLLRLLLSLTIASQALSESLDSVAASKFWRSKARNEFAVNVDKAFRSNRFNAVGGLRGTDLASAAYSPTGSVYQSLYIKADGSIDNTCSDVSAVIGFTVNQCVVMSSYAFKVQLVSDSCSGAVIQYFGDLKCKTFLGTSSLDDFPLGCAPTQDPKADPNEYQQVQCTTNAAPPLPGTNVIAGEFYEDLTCSGEAVEYEAFVIDKCFHMEPFYGSYKCDDDEPMFNMYTTENCVGEPEQSFSFPNQCYPEEDDVVYDDTYTDTYLPPIINPPPSVSATPFPTNHGHARSTAVFCTINEPSLNPVSIPTAFPTRSTKQKVTFDATQVLYGVSAAIVNAQSANTDVLKSTIAATMTNVETDAITNLVVTDAISPTARSHLSRAVDVGVRALQTSSGTLNMAYTVMVETSLSASYLAAQLTAAVTSGSFNTALQNNAARGATDLLGCTSDTVLTKVAVEEGSDGEATDDSRPLDGGGIFGVVVGVMFIVTMLAGVVYVMLMIK